MWRCIWFIYSSVGGHFNYVHLLAFMNNVAMEMHIIYFVLNMLSFFFGVFLEELITVSYNCWATELFIHLRNYQTALFHLFGSMWRGGKRQRETRYRNSHLLLHFPKVHNSQTRARPKLGARNPIQAANLGVRDRSIWAIT